MKSSQRYKPIDAVYLKLHAIGASGAPESDVESIPVRALITGMLLF